MLTITKTTNCSSISITSNSFSDYLESGTTITSLKLFWSYNGSAYTEYEIQEEDITEDTITLDVEFFSQNDDVLCDGIYCFRLEVIDDDVLTKYYGSAFINCSIVCSIAEKLWNNPELNIYSKLEAIKYYQSCNECDCSTLYLLYQDLLCDLGLLNSDCGCSQ